MQRRPIKPSGHGRHVCRLVWLLSVSVCLAEFDRGTLGGPPQQAEQSVDYTDAIGRFEETIQAELDRGLLTGVSVALVDDQRTVFAGGFGLADKRTGRQASADTVYRAGSISKLFTALAAAQLVERGLIDLDAPVSEYLPDFRIVVPFENCPPITLRQLMCHRSGLIRESPLGGYLDDSQPTIAATVTSVAPCVLVHRPDTVTKYSNLGVTVVGQAVARVADVPFETYQQEQLIGPMGIKSTSFILDERLEERLSTSYMRVADGRDGFFTIESPVFQLGTIPAGNLYTTAEDLARLLSVLFADGLAGDRRIVRSDTLQQMFTPQLTGEAEGFGLGFNVTRFRGRRRVGHSGAVYGFSSTVAGLVQEKLGVVVLANEDITSGPVRKLADAALDLLLEAKLGEPPPAKEEPIQIDADQLARFTGDYESESYWARIEAGDGLLRVNLAGQPITLTCVGPNRFLGEGRRANEAPFEFDVDNDGPTTGFTAMGQKFRRVDPKGVPEVPDAYKKYLGGYGPGFIPLVISVKYGHLYAMTENMADYRLRPLNRTVFGMPPGLYADEQLVFHVDAGGKVHSVTLANMTLARRNP